MPQHWRRLVGLLILQKTIDFGDDFVQAFGAAQRRVDGSRCIEFIKISDIFIILFIIIHHIFETMAPQYFSGQI